LSLAKHVRLLVLATLTWAAFWVLGLPRYYQQYSTWTMAVLSLVLLAVLAVALPRVFRPMRASRRMAASWWIAFYFTVPLAAYDALYCGVSLGHGWAFLWRYWYLTIYYFIPWVVLPTAAALATGGDRVPAPRTGQGGSRAA
jgi:hypothetical protein